jgi:hypothetical protein
VDGGPIARAAGTGAAGLRVVELQGPRKDERGAGACSQRSNPQRDAGGSCHLALPFEGAAGPLLGDGTPGPAVSI